MKISDVENALKSIREQHGDIPCQLQDDGKENIGGIICGYPDFFIVAEQYPDDGMICNLRWWPY